MKLHYLIALTMGLLPAGDAPKDDPAQKELEKLQGTWAAVSIEVNGENLGDEVVKSFKLTIKGDQAGVKALADVTDQYSKLTLKVDPGTKPKLLDLKVTGGSEKGRTIEGIYELDGDNLKVCADLTAKNRPGEFASKPGSNCVLIVFKREKE